MHTKTDETVAGPWGETIYSYTRAAALADGYLVDVTDTAREAGFKVPMALTRAVWNDCVEWTKADTDRTRCPQDRAGRLWDVVNMTRFWFQVATRRNPDTDRATVELFRVPLDGSGRQPRRVLLLAVIGPGDQGEPVITVGLEDDF